jgi:ubiquitin-conjugating enzyme (huntingtin interacting protein 2)
VYAKGPHKFPDFDQKIQRLKDMGVGDFDARAALSRHNWDINLATNDIF